MYQELENKALAEFEEKFVEDRGRYVEPIFKDAVGSVGPIKNFLKSHLKEAYEAGVDKTIERFATGELLKSDDAQKFYDLAYKAGQEEGLNLRKAYNDPELLNQIKQQTLKQIEEGLPKEKHFKNLTSEERLTAAINGRTIESKSEIKGYNKAIKDLKKFINTL